MMFWMLPSALACGSISADAWSLTRETALRYGLEPELLAALVWQESRYCEEALSPKGAVGLGQLMPDTALELGVDPHDPVANLNGAARYLVMQYREFGSWPLALAAYNAGPEAVRRAGGIPPFEETQLYVPSVLNQYQHFRTQTADAVVAATQPQGVQAAQTPVPVAEPGERLEPTPVETNVPMRYVPQLIVFPEHSTLGARLSR